MRRTVRRQEPMRLLPTVRRGRSGGGSHRRPPEAQLGAALVQGAARRLRHGPVDDYDIGTRSAAVVVPPARLNVVEPGRVFR